MNERAAPTEPPIFLADGRLSIYADGEWQAFSQDSRSWTTGVLSARDVSALMGYLPIVADNTMNVYDQEVTG